MQTKTVQFPEEFLDHFVNRLIRDVDVVDLIQLDLNEGWFSLRAEGRKRVGGMIDVDYLVEADFELDLVHYTGSEQILEFTKRGETRVEGREYLDNILTNFAGDPINTLLLDWEFVNREDDTYIFRLGETALGTFFGSSLMEAPVTELLPIHEMVLREGALEFELVC